MNGRIVGLVDSGLDGPLTERTAAACRFASGLDTPGVRLPPIADHHGHGSIIASVIAQQAPQVNFANAQVFGARDVTSSHAVAAALDWLHELNVRLVNLSLGLHADRDILKSAVQHALEAGMLLVAASPARGAPVYPAAYPGVLRVTGDARCAPGEISWLDSAQADCGACPRPDHEESPGQPAGASLATARITGLLAASYHGDPGGAMDWLRQRSRWSGPERRRA